MASARVSNPPRTPGLALPEPGERVDVFALEAAIGAGGMGAVYKAADIKLDRYVALKILPPDQAVDPEVVQRYYQEGRAAARLDHENIARVFTIGFDGRYHFIAFEYVEGTTIRQVVEERGPFAAEGAIHLTLQIAGALVHAAARGVVHRDIKPSNIIVTPQGRAKLVDMGLARRFERADETELTRSGMTLGTFDYISPEQALDPRNVDIRSDLYSLGCTLFHMLSGQPPFPEGTLAQKLLNHQKDAPPDIRQLNPAVPDGLAAVLVKLMAKDRDRRYQSPEQVARDLLTLAGSLGLRLDAPDTVAWTPPAARPAWERHLAWAVPVAAFVLILVGLYWMGDGPVQVVLPPEAERPITKTRPNPVQANPRPPAPDPEGPRDLAVRSSDDLIRALANAPRRSTLFLVENGPYVIKPAAARKLAGIDVTIKAEEGVRPVLRLAEPAPGEPDAEPRAILDLAGGRLQVEGVTFLVESENAVAIRAEDADLAVRRCQFLRTGERARPVSRPAAILARAGARAGAAGERGGSVAADASYFAAGQAAVLASGPVQVNARDCLIAPSPSDLASFWFDNPASAASPAAIRLAHVSILAEAGPVFRFTGTQPHVQLTRSVVGSPGSTPATLVLIDDPGRLDWWGEDNVFARVGFYIQPTDPASDEAPIRSFADWADSPRTFREAGSIPLDRSPWDDPDPVSALARRGDDLGRALGLSLPAREVALRVGARQGPTGAIPVPTVAATAVAAAPPRATAPPAPEPARPVEDEPAPPPAVPAPMPMPMPMPMPARDPEADDGAAMVPMPTMPTTPRRAPIDGGPGEPADEPARAEPDPPRPPLAQVGPPMAAAEPRPDWMGTPASRPAEAAPVIRTPAEFLQALNRPSTQPVRTLTVAADADWSLPAIRLAPGSLVVRAQPGATRPRLRFRPDADQIAGAWDWPAFLTIPSGVVRLEGIDLLLAAEDAPMPGRWAAFEVRSGSAQLELVGCSVTIEGVDARSALVVVASAEASSATAPDPAEPAPMAAARVRLQDGWFRVGGDLVDVAAGVRLDLGLDGVAAATAGALLREHGSPEGKPPGLTRLEIQRSTIRSPGHLVRVESTPEAPEIPAVEVAARNAVFATDEADAALIRVSGQDDASRWADRVRWNGEGLGYHRVGVLRLDEEGPARMVARRLGRSAWDRAAEVSDRGSFHGDLRFSREWSPDRRPWNLGRDDFQLRADSPVGLAGVDPRRLPGPAYP